VVTNTMSRESVEALAEKATAEFGDVHIVCNNAGVVTTGMKPIWEVADADWQWVMGVNFWGVLYGIQAFVPRMLAHGGEGHIVNTASLAGLLTGNGVYGVSKHAVVALTESLYNDLRLAGARVGASVLCPGFVHTRIHEAERNRPTELATGVAPNSAIMAEWIARGMEPAAVAEEAFESIENERFYILPHTAWDDSVRSRFEHIVARGNPPAFDPDFITRRQAAGEQL
jgi:NAD(P)-dependent dehydrogenase (short-subunit alcohol dehydrogenase family)